MGLRLRGGVITTHVGQRAEGAVRDLGALGVDAVGADRTRAFGRGGCGVRPTVDDLCGYCAHGKIAVGPDGDVWPCVLGRFITLGNALRTPLADIWNSSSTDEARRMIKEAHTDGLPQSCTPPQFLPVCGPCGPCVPSVEQCDPRAADGGGGSLRSGAVGSGS